MLRARRFSHRLSRPSPLRGRPGPKKPDPLVAVEEDPHLHLWAPAGAPEDDVRRPVDAEPRGMIAAGGSGGSSSDGDSRRKLSAKTTNGSTNESTGLSPQAASRCWLLQRHIAIVAATFSSPQFAAAVRAGLLIPRSQVRSLPGPFFSQHRSCRAEQLSTEAGALCKSNTAASPGFRQVRGLLRERVTHTARIRSAESGHRTSGS